MTEPLIDPVKLRMVVFATETGRTLDERLLDYLKSVLTPEALWPIWVEHGNSIYRRIFGEDKETTAKQECSIPSVGGLWLEGEV